ncbi:MAG: 5'-methylthioadenosine/adenosylhomocysteine nucleosidase [Bacillota bacterium]|nr:5'-methylthioadenosine/adenosylhomocysteine nucleosidase [Bacillota bacterium]
MKFGILGAMESEVKLILDHIEDLASKEISGFTYYTGKYKGKDLVVAQCSIGKVNSALSTQIMIDKFGPDFIINTGIAGGLDSRLDVLSVVIGEKLTFHDFDHEILKAYFPYQEYFYADQRAVKLAEEIFSREGLKHFTGTIVTGDLFVEDSKKKAQLQEDFSALCVEMEGAAIANTAFINKLPFIVIRTISDLADDGGSMTYDEFKVEASDNSAKMVLALVEEF